MLVEGNGGGGRLPPDSVVDASATGGHSASVLVVETRRSCRRVVVFCPAGAAPVGSSFSSKPKFWKGEMTDLLLLPLSQIIAKSFCSTGGENEASTDSGEAEGKRALPLVVGMLPMLARDELRFLGWPGRPEMLPTLGSSMCSSSSSTRGGIARGTGVVVGTGERRRERTTSRWRERCVLCVFLYR